jgi:hypothetical protein
MDGDAIIVGVTEMTTGITSAPGIGVIAPQATATMTDMADWYAGILTQEPGIFIDKKEAGS